MTYADGCYVGQRVKLELLGADELRQIHEATLDVLAEIGVTFHSQARARRARGARRDGRPRGRPSPSCRPS